MERERSFHTATLLPDGQVLVVGGCLVLEDINCVPTNVAEVYDPKKGTWSNAGLLALGRRYHSATLLRNVNEHNLEFRVLIAGGDISFNAPTDTTEIYNGSRWEPGPPMNELRLAHSATLLDDGRVLVAGGRRIRVSDTSPRIGVSETSEIYDPKIPAATATTTSPKGTWMSGPGLVQARYGHAAALLESGTHRGEVLLSGGLKADGSKTLKTTEVLAPGGSSGEAGDPCDPSNDASPAEDCPEGRAFHTMTVLKNGNLLVVGGMGRDDSVSSPLSSAEVFDPDAAEPKPKWSNAGEMTAARSAGTNDLDGGHTATLLQDHDSRGECRRVLVLGGVKKVSENESLAGLPFAELYDPCAGGVGGPTPTPIPTLEPPEPLPPPDLQPVSGIWRRLGPMVASRSFQAATTLAGGKVLITGGCPARTAADDALIRTCSAPTSSAEIFDMKTATFASSPPMGESRLLHSADLLRSGKLLVVSTDPAGALDNSSNPEDPGLVPTAELFDPGQQRWAPVKKEPPRRLGVTKGVALANGNVLFAGLGSAYVFDYAFDVGTGRWVDTEQMELFHKDFHAAGRLSDGRVLLVGGGDPPPGQDTDQSSIYKPPHDNSWHTPKQHPIQRQSGHSLVTLERPDCDQICREAFKCGRLCGATLLVGGFNEGLGEQRYMNEVEAFDAANDFWRPLPGMTVGRRGHATVVLPNGQILVAGGWNKFESNPNRSAELFDPGSERWFPAGHFESARPSFDSFYRPLSAILLSADPFTFRPDVSVCGENCGKVLLIGGSGDNTAELYTPGPEVHAIIPSAGLAGTEVTVSGSGFLNGPGARPHQVLFGGIPASAFSVDSFYRLRAIAPPGLGAGSVTSVQVVTDGGTSNRTTDARFAYLGSVASVPIIQDDPIPPALQILTRANEPQPPGTTVRASSPARRRAPAPPTQTATASKTTAGPPPIQLGPGADPQRAGVPKKSHPPSVRATGQDPALPTWVKVVVGASAAALLVAIVAYMIQGRVLSNLLKHK